MTGVQTCGLPIWLLEYEAKSGVTKPFLETIRFIIEKVDTGCFDKNAAFPRNQSLSNLEIPVKESPI